MCESRTCPRDQLPPNLDTHQTRIINIGDRNFSFCLIPEGRNSTSSTEGECAIIAAAHLAQLDNSTVYETKCPKYGPFCFTLTPRRTSPASAHGE